MSWKTDKWWVSPYNFIEEARKDMHFPEKIQLHDISLRDGEQQPGIVFRKDDKIKIARKLDEVGVHRIEAGLPAVSKEDEKAIRAIVKLGLKADIYVLCRADKSDVDLALKCDVKNVVLEVPSSDVLIEKGFQWTKEKVMGLALDALTYAKDHGLHVVFFPYDTTRANFDFESKLVKMAVEEAHVDGVTIVDTFGVATPDAIAYLVRRMKEIVNVPIEVHCHNDLGHALINSIAGVAAGAECIHTSVNGIGDSSGNAPLEQVAVSLPMLYGVDLGLNLGKIYELSKLVEKLSGIQIAPGRPVVGENIFRKESGIFVMFRDRSLASGVPTASCAFLPSLLDPRRVGKEFDVVLGKKSGKASVAAKLRELGWSATEGQMDSCLLYTSDAADE